MSKHILVVSQYFYPEQFRINDMCQEWVKKGYKVTVVTGIPNYPEGKFYKGYNWFKKRKEYINGVNVIRIPLLARGKNALSLYLNYKSFVFFGWFFAKFTKLKADYVFTYEVSPIYQAKIGIWYAKRRKIPSVLYVMDLWPDNLIAAGNVDSKLIIKSVTRTVKKIYKQTDYILTSSKSFIKSIKELKVPETKLEFWPQYAEDFYLPLEKTAKEITNIPQDSRVNLVFAGNIGKAQGLEILPRCAIELERRKVKVRFNMIGDGRDKVALVKKVYDFLVTPYFNFIDKVDATEIPYYFAYCEAGIITFNDNPILEKTIPAKLQSYLACGLPIIASAKGEVKRIIEEGELGFVGNAGSVNALADAIEEFVRLYPAQRVVLKNNALNYSKEKFNKVKLLNRLDKIFEGLENGSLGKPIVEEVKKAVVCKTKSSKK